MVGTTNKSMGANGRCLCRKVRHPGVGGPRRLIMYLATLDCAKLEQFPVDAWRSTKRVLDAHPPDQHAKLGLDLWPPSQSARLPTPITAKAGLMPTHEGVGPDDCEDLQDRREPTIKLNEEPAIVVRKLGPAPRLAAQDDQLMSERRILRLKPALRLEWRDQDG